MKRTFAVSVALLVLATPAVARTRVVRQISAEWQQPQCAQVAGLPWIGFIDANGGIHQADPALETQPRTTPETESIAAATAANVLFATMTDGSIHQSDDAGCSWHLRARVPEALAGLPEEPRILAQHLSRVYVVTASQIVRLTQATVETFPLAEATLSVDVDPKDRDHLRAIAKHGNVYESRDGAASWTRIGSAGVFTTVNAAATDPANFDHVLAGTVGAILSSRDGGRSWTPIGMTTKQPRRIAFSPADSAVIWVDAFDGPHNSATLFVSQDSGATFRVVDRTTRRIDFTYGPLSPHPVDTSLVGIAPGLGVAVYSPDGLRNAIFANNTRAVIWSPAGTMYYVVHVLRTL